MKGEAEALVRAQAQARLALREMFQNMHREIRGVLLSGAEQTQGLEPQRTPRTPRKAEDNAGVVPTKNKNRVLSEVGAIVRRYFVGADGRSAFGVDGVTPLAQYPAILNRFLVQVTRDVVKVHALKVEKLAPADVLNWLKNGRLVQEKLFVPNELASYDAPHTWVDPNGYRLSDRIWRAEEVTRRRIDEVLTKGIGNGNSAVRLARQLEQYVLPARQMIFTDRPYGERYPDLSYDAMRLARSEIARAQGEAARIAAVMNPFVESVNWNLSPSHPKFDICDGLAAGSPYKPENAPVPVADSHSQCLCSISSNVTGTPAEVIAEIREAMAVGEVATVNPANERDFLTQLLGRELVMWAVMGGV